MKKISNLFTALVTVTLSLTALTLWSCSDDDDISSNVERYQQAVDATVKANKSSDKVILLVAFGSTWQQAFDTFDETLEAYEEAYPSYDIFLSFSSAICINRAAAGENTTARNFYAPAYWLEAFGRVQYETIVVQSLQVIPGEEYARVVSYVKDFANNSNADLDDDYLAGVNLYIGTPLMADVEDVTTVAEAIDSNFKSYAASNLVAFMGHGNPEEYDTYSANIRYTQLEEALQEINPNYYVGTVDMPENYKVQVLERMQEDGNTSGTVYCAPLMSIAGDHAHNDMAGDDDLSVYVTNSEGEVEDVSWKCYFAGNGYTCNDDTQLTYGLLEYESIRQIWMDHTQAALDGDPLDYYHSMNPEE